MQLSDAFFNSCEQCVVFTKTVSIHRLEPVLCSFFIFCKIAVKIIFELRPGIIFIDQES